MKQRIEREPFLPVHCAFMHIEEDTKVESDTLPSCWALRHLSDLVAQYFLPGQVMDYLFLIFFFLSFLIIW